MPPFGNFISSRVVDASLKAHPGSLQRRNACRDDPHELRRFERVELRLARSAFCDTDPWRRRSVEGSLEVVGEGSRLSSANLRLCKALHMRFAAPKHIETARCGALRRFRPVSRAQGKPRERRAPYPFGTCAAIALSAAAGFTDEWRIVLELSGDLNRLAQVGHQSVVRG